MTPARTLFSRAEGLLENERKQLSNSRAERCGCRRRVFLRSVGPIAANQTTFLAGRGRRKGTAQCATARTGWGWLVGDGQHQCASHGGQPQENIGKGGFQAETKNHEALRGKHVEDFIT